MSGGGVTAIRDEPVAAASLGVPVMRGKRIVFVVAAAGCALAGGLLALSTLQVRPDSMFRVDFAVWMIFIVVIGADIVVRNVIVVESLIRIFRQLEFLDHLCSHGFSGSRWPMKEHQCACTILNSLFKTPLFADL